MNVRRAHDGERPAVMTVLDAGLLAVGADAVAAAIDEGRVLVAVEGDRVLGALVLGDADEAGRTRIEAVAVRPGRRGQGLGRALVGAAADRHGDLVAEFDTRVKPFWHALGFEVEAAAAPGRLEGTLDLGPDDG